MAVTIVCISVQMYYHVCLLPFVDMTCLLAVGVHDGPCRIYVVSLMCVAVRERVLRQFVTIVCDFIYMYYHSCVLPFVNMSRGSS